MMIIILIITAELLMCCSINSVNRLGQGRVKKNRHRPLCDSNMLNCRDLKKSFLKCCVATSWHKSSKNKTAVKRISSVCRL